MSPGAGAPGHPVRILIVDDERQNRTLLQAMLEPEGFVLQTASTGEEALALVAALPPDLILLDVMMPGMDGFEVAGKLKGNPDTSNIPIIMITALDDRGARMLGLNVGAEDFLTKPVDRSELRVRVRNLLRLKTRADYSDWYGETLKKEVDERTRDLMENVRLYDSTFDASPVGIVHVGMDGRWLRMNQRLLNFLGYSRDQLQGTGARDRLETDEAAGEAEAFRQMAAGTLDRHVVEAKRYRRQDGVDVWARVNTSVHRDAEGRADRYISMIEDITERRGLEAQVRQTGKMDAIGRLASGIAHDFTNLLSVVICYAEMLTDDATVADQHKELVREISKAARSATALTAQLLAFSRQQVLHAAPLDLNGLITEMMEMLGRLIGGHIAITLELAPNLALAVVDRGQIEQVITNLVVNARDAMPVGGRVTIRTSEISVDDAGPNGETAMPGHYVLLTVADTGGGMTPESSRRLFEPFFTTKEPGKGAGLGLSTTYGIVKQSDGYIWAYSEMGRGTTFKVYLPRAAGAHAVTA